MKKLLLVGIILTMVTGAIPVLAGEVTKTYENITLPPSDLGDYWLPDIWDLNACDVTVSYKLDLSGAPNVDYDWNWNNSGNVGLFSNEGPFTGANMSGFLADWGNPLTQFPTYPDNDVSLDNDDKFNLQRFPNPGSYDEQMYDVDCVNNTVGAFNFNPWLNYGIWFDRDGVDQWQSAMWGMVNGGTYKTLGVYDVEILYRKSSDYLTTGKGTACATFFPTLANQYNPPSNYGIPTGFYTTWHSGAPDFYPAGISFEADEAKMAQMLVRIQGSSGPSPGTIVVKNITVTGCLTTPERFKQLALDSLNELYATLTDKEDKSKLSDAIEHLQKSLKADRWLDASHLKPGAKGEGVFNEEKASVNKLKELRNNNDSGLSATLMQGYIDQLLAADRLLAEIAISDAIARGGNAGKIKTANDELIKGDVEKGKDHPNKAIDHYKNAWKNAVAA